MTRSEKIQLLYVSLFGIAFGYVETSVVVYLRALYYPGGFSFPLKAMPAPHALVELFREFATIMMLVAVGLISGKNRWTRFSYFMIAFGVWDLFFYIWLKILLGWPTSLFDWDILFLIPIPWIGTVIAPCLISLLMIAAGVLIIRHEEISPFHPPVIAWVAGCAGALSMLYTFMRDTNATIHFQLPEPYRYEILIAGMLLCIWALIRSLRGSRSHS